MKASKVATTLGALLAFSAAVAHADDATPPDNSVRVGLYYVTFHVHSTDIAGPYTPPGLQIDVKDLETVYLAYIRRLSPHFDFEFAFGYPPLTKTIGHGPEYVGSVPFNGQEIATARWISPSALIEYKFLDESAPLRPYFGFGLNYTKFYSRQSTAAGDALTGGPTQISLPVSVGPAATIGLSYNLSSRWSLHASYSIAQVDTKLTTDTAGVIRSAHIDFWPTAFVFSGGYSF